jgi:hypothetical protein
MPLAHADDHGTDAHGVHVEDYCRFCYTHGAFTDPTATSESMTDLCTRILVQRGMADRDARALMATTIPTLKRWAESRAFQWTERPSVARGAP